jgi:hypothetical protein
MHLCRLQLPMLKQRWMLIVFGLVMQYVHGIFTQLAHRMHEPHDDPLPDLGFELTPVSARARWLHHFIRMCYYDAHASVAGQFLVPVCPLHVHNISMHCTGSGCSSAVLTPTMYAGAGP